MASHQLNVWVEREFPLVEYHAGRVTFNILFCLVMAKIRAKPGNADTTAECLANWSLIYVTVAHVMERDRKSQQQLRNPQASGINSQ